jgi:hypothetical protein
MAKYQHECRGTRFDIEVDVLKLADDRPARFFIARIRKTEQAAAAIVEKRSCQREVYGQSEAWALKNARALLDCENWTVDDEPVRRLTHDPEPMAVWRSPAPRSQESPNRASL